VTRLALISPVNPYPVDAGKKVVLAGLVKYFAERLSADAVHYLLIGDEPTGRFPVDVRPIAGPTAAQAIRNVGLRAMSGRSSIQESFLWSRGTRAAMTETLRELDADIEVYDTVRTAQYADGDSGRRRICYMDDLFSVRYADMLKSIKRDPSVKFRPLGNFAARVPAKLHFLTEARMSQRALLEGEKRLVAKSENRTARDFDRCLLVNGHESEVLRARAEVPAARVVTIPPLIAAPAAGTRTYRGAPQFLFLGLLSLPHNDDGLRTFVRDTWPTVIRRMPRARLRVVGREPQPELRAVISEFGGGAVTLEGYVPDLDVLMTQSAAMLNPLRMGSGIKLKVIESLGRGLPVISSRIGVDGMWSGPANGILLADGTDEWVDQMERLTSPVDNADVSAAGSEHFTRRYSQPAVFAAYDDAFGLGPAGSYRTNGERLNMMPTR
jgi:glycosyltransferase involved in cell wall biosynthesis